MNPVDAERLIRELGPQVLGSLTRRYCDFAAAEDAVQEALLAAARQWPAEGIPENPKAWLTHVASRRMVDEIRGEVARRKREMDAAWRRAPALRRCPKPRAWTTTRSF